VAAAAVLATRAEPTTAFVLSGGASLGAVQAGMLHALYERGVTADLLVGTSVGALNAAFVASRPQTPATARELARVWRGVQREDVFPVSLRTVVGGLSGQRDHLVPARGVRQIVQRHVELDDLADAATPLHVVAYDIEAGDEAVLSEGPAVDSVVAACSIPGVLPPVAIGDRLLIDGGVVNNTPIAHAVELGAERIFVLPTQELCARPDPPRTALDAAIYGLLLLVGSRLDADIARYRHDVELIVLPPSNSQHVQPTDFEHSSRLTAEAHAAAREALVRAAAPMALAA
jgi:NTE family protein